MRVIKTIVLLPGSDFRPWLFERSKYGGRFGNETKDARGRVRVWLTRNHPYANATGMQWRYRLRMIYALNRKLSPNEHVDHENGIVNDDRISNLRLLSAEFHGAHHARLFQLAGCVDKNGRFQELDEPVEVLCCRFRYLISSREITDDGLPESRTL